MPKNTHFPSGPIAVEDARLTDISAGMNWNMQDASDVRFLAVSGTLWVGDCRTTYDFTLVEYHLHIDEVSWIIFSTLNNALEKEFAPEFWDIVNYSRKERWGFLEIPWDGKAYEVASPYTQIRLSIFNEIAHEGCETFRVEGHLPQGSSERGSGFQRAEEIGLPASFDYRGPCLTTAYPTLLGKR